MTPRKSRLGDKSHPLKLSKQQQDLAERIIRENGALIRNAMHAAGVPQPPDNKLEAAVTADWLAAMATGIFIAVKWLDELDENRPQTMNPKNKTQTD